MNAVSKPMLILIAGPYRSGTGDDPIKMAENLSRLESVAVPLFRAGHIPMIGEWVALPLGRQAGSKGAGDPLYDEFAYPVADRLLRHCDAVLRLPGASKGADEDVRLAVERGLKVYYDLSEVPGAA
ncbi:hypothetical protein J2X50_001475 [Aminobacter sp. BE322]